MYSVGGVPGARATPRPRLLYAAHGAVQPEPPASCAAGHWRSGSANVALRSTTPGMARSRAERHLVASGHLPPGDGRGGDAGADVASSRRPWRASAASRALPAWCRRRPDVEPTRQCVTRSSWMPEAARHSPGPGCTPRSLKPNARTQPSQQNVMEPSKIWVPGTCCRRRRPHVTPHTHKTKMRKQILRHVCATRRALATSTVCSLPVPLSLSKQRGTSRSSPLHLARAPSGIQVGPTRLPATETAPWWH